MRSFAGFNFKTGKITEAQKRVLDNYLTSFAQTNPGLDTSPYGRPTIPASEWKIKDKTYLLRSELASLAIFGVGSYDIEQTDGIIWGSDEEVVRQILLSMGILDFFPYRVEENAIYLVEDGEVYLFMRKGERITTPQGKGIIYSIDDLNDICVELDDDKELFYEFGVNEIDKVKDK